MMNRIDVGSTPFVKIALIGDSGVGKSTLTSVLATGCFELSPIYRPTIGCVIQVLHSVHQVQGKYFIELWDLGGNPRFADARPVCYEDCDGYIFLWDSSSEATYHSLQSWLAEVTKARRMNFMKGDRRDEPINKVDNISPNNSKSDVFDLEGGESRIPLQTEQVENGDDPIPLLIVANKIDKLSLTERVALQTACAQQIFVSSRSLDECDPAPFLKFFDEVYDKLRSRQEKDLLVKKSSLTSTISNQFSSTSTSFSFLPQQINNNNIMIEHQNSCDTSDATTPDKIRNNNDTSTESTPVILKKSSGAEITWTSPLRGFTSSLFSLSSSASSLRYRAGTTPHTPDHTHSLDDI